MTSLHLSNSLVPLRYDLHLNINHLRPNFHGTASIKLVRNPTGSTVRDSFWLQLHASSLVVTKAVAVLPRDPSIEISLVVTTDRAALLVTFTATDVPMPVEATIVISYIARINIIKTFQDPTIGLFQTNYSDPISGRSNNYILATHFQPHYAKTVLPLIEELSLKVPIQLSITTAAKFTVVSNTSLHHKTAAESDPSNATFIFKESPPIAPSVFGFVIGDLDHIETTLPSIKLGIYTPVGQSEGARYALSLVEKFLPIIQSLMRTPYPLEKCDFVALPFLSDGAMENWGMVATLALQILLDEEDLTVMQKLHIQQLVAHELVHQWVGNLVSFDSWSCIWLNEAFATWLGNYAVYLSGINASLGVEYDPEMERMLEMERLLSSEWLIGKNDTLMVPSIQQYTASVDVSGNASTATIFDAQSYQKGISLLTMMGYAMHPKISNGPVYDNMIENIATSVVAKHQFASIKTMDIWKSLTPVTSFDAAAFAYSWQNQQGYPLVTVTTNPQRTKLFFEQHLHIWNLTVDQVKMEDKPFQVPLRLKVIPETGEEYRLINNLMNDRKLELDITTSQFLCANSNRAGYYRVHYSPEIIVDSIVPAIKSGSLEATEIFALINDYRKCIGTVFSKSDHLILLIKIIDVLPDTTGEVNWFVWNTALTTLSTIVETLRHFSDYTKFGEWLEKFVVRSLDRVGGWNSLTTSSSLTLEMQTRNTLLQLGLDVSPCQVIAQNLFKPFISGKKSQIPPQMMSSVFNLSIQKASQKEFKRVLEFVKNPNLLPTQPLVNVTELYTTALMSLLFVKNEDLASKARSFIHSHIDTTKNIELGLTAFRYQLSKKAKLCLFKWFALHYDDWVRGVLRSKESSTLSYITHLVLCLVMQYDPELLKLKQDFTQKKLASLPPHGLKDCLELAEPHEEEQKIIASFYNELIHVL